MKFKNNFFLIVFLLAGSFSRAQEIILPLGYNPLLPSSVNEKKQTGLKKSGANFPLLDFFQQEGKANSAFWQSGNCDIKKNRVVFNVLDSNNSLYPAGQVADQLLSQVISTQNETRPIFISFSYVAGESFSTGDSLLLYAKNIFGEWKLIWKSADQPTQLREVILDLPSSEFKTDQFGLKFSCFSAQVFSWNTATFYLSKLVLSTKWPLPYHDNLHAFQVPDSTASWEYFSGPNTKVIEGANVGFIWGNCAKLDIKDYRDSIYENANNSYGGADTLYTHPFDLFQADVADSIFYTFGLIPGATNFANDSLIVEFYNNLGQWIRVLALTGNASSALNTFSFNINVGRFRHANFRSRFVFKSTYAVANKGHWLLSGFRVVKRIPLPLFDDFSNARVQVSKSRWMDTTVFVNNDFPIKHPSLNVATFDGLDASGNPYSKFASKGICDVLTSHSMNLKGIIPADSVILSFYYQYEPQGSTSQVYPDDVLYVDMRNTAMEKDSFSQIAAIVADDSLLFNFHLFQYTIKDPKFFHDDFQIRIRNKGSLTGNLSQWHIDYLRFNKGRKLNDPLKDLALSNTPNIKLGYYTAMPWYQYQANKNNYPNGISALRLVNHDNQPYAVDYFRSVLKPEGDTLDKFNNILPTIKANSDSIVSINKNFTFSSSLNADSLVFQTRYRIKISGNQNDNVTGNDTFTVPTVFSNYYAYDDGTAEGGYGIKNKINVGACLQYKTELPDSVYGVYIFFNQSEKDVSTQSFSIKVWKNISPLFEPATADVLLYSQDVSKPTYTNKINGFTSYRFNQPVAVSDSFYIGWDQASAYVLNVGLDKNFTFDINPYMAYKMDGRWYPTEIPGALMIRPIMGKFLGIPTGLIKANIESESAEFNVYPNPATTELFSDLQELEKYTIRLYNLMGAELAKLQATENRMSLPELKDGFYLITFENVSENKKFVKKIIINRN